MPITGHRKRGGGKELLTLPGHLFPSTKVSSPPLGSFVKGTSSSNMSVTGGSWWCSPDGWDHFELLWKVGLV